MDSKAETPQIDFSRPSMRLLRLWLAAAPLGMLALAILFAILAAGDENWIVFGAMFGLGALALGLFFLQWRVVSRYLRKLG